MFSLYVVAIRVHGIDKLRVLPFWKEDADCLKSLKVDPLQALVPKLQKRRNMEM